MNWVVIPLTRIGGVPKFTTSNFVLSLLVHIVFLGAPAAGDVDEHVERPHHRG